MSDSRCAASVGRPRAFDKDVALEKALEVFWRKGYDGTSLTDLTEAMGINKPSLYSAFGNKDQLFLKAIEVYENRPHAFFSPALNEPTVYNVVKKMLYGAAVSFADSSHPQGCVIVQGALSCSETANAMKEELIARRQDGEQRLRDRLIRAQAEGEIPATTNVVTWARYLGTIIQGMAIQANNGATPEELIEVADLAISALPAMNPQPDSK